MKDAWMNKDALIASTYVRGSNGEEKRNWRGEKTNNRERDRETNTAGSNKIT